ncbi:hypothetical protein AAFC00_002045 [Neodothiora populina]|uniref:Uncharacterized protein n=1 Tax=Neodothiora populina TaxID=2781224 RepID=A0ABR3PG36_9PEZI
MRRRTRKHLFHAAIFGSVLFLIIYLGGSQSNGKVFKWTEIHYKTSAATLPEARGVCPGLEKNTKPALIVSRVSADGDSKWLKTLSSKYHLCIYAVDAPKDTKSTYLQVPANRGHEAMAYLTFIIDNYAAIPASGAVFVHGSRWAWHNDSPEYDNAALLAALRVESALEPYGYHNLRCDWSASTCSASYGPAQGSLETSMNAVMQPWDARTVSDKALPRALADLFGGEESDSPRRRDVLLGRSDPVKSQCCAQFVVARENIWRHSRDEYVALRQWLLDSSDSDSDDETNPPTPRQGRTSYASAAAAPSDDRVAGRILSYLWHILFMRPETDGSGNMNLARLNQQACPRADECYCRLYGRCGLEGCGVSPEQCFGQYTLPPDFQLPANWEEAHS